MSTSDPGRKARRPDVDGETTLDAVDHTAVDDLAFLVAVLDLLPDAHALCLDLGEHDVAFGALGLLEQDFDLVADVDGRLAVGARELANRNEAFGLVADVDDDLVVGHLDDDPVDDLAFGEVTHALVVQRDELFVTQVVFVISRIGRNRCGRLFRLLLRGLHSVDCLLRLTIQVAGSDKSWAHPANPLGIWMGEMRTSSKGNLGRTRNHRV